ncbi:aminotransferase class I/II-fold pyridoxal phosphate-dependent enzyme [Patescibacteria group bacterium]|nr:aminotransferase class I/II-fold pyridoxal phosphate-dependent enzyme [Patescibacteria group bacterium]
MIKPISISLSPNTEQDDVWLAFKLIFQPWRWKRGPELDRVEHEFKGYLGTQNVCAFNSGRSAFLAILHALELKEGDEILLQAFTCNAVPNPVIWSGLKPVYVDCNEDDYNIDTEDLERKITQRSKAVVVQHTFGLSAAMDTIVELCQRHNLILIEDCAHALGAEFQGQKVGTFGKAAFFSFSRDKVISSVYGGMATTNDDELATKIRDFQNTAGDASFFWVLQQLLHPVGMNWGILPLYGIFGKYALVAAQQLHILSKAVHWKEKRGKQPGYFPRRLPNALATLALHQLGKVDRFNGYRRELADMYYESLRNSSFELLAEFPKRKNIFLRFPIKHLRAHEIIKKAWARNLLLGDWYTNPVAPDDTQLDAMGYKTGSCPTAEKLSRITLNLPTHINISEKNAETIIDFLNEYGN